jgi:hypothetical protein
VVSTVQANAGPSPTGEAALRCAGCAAPLAADQRYCLECGARTSWAGGVLAADPRAAFTAGRSPIALGATTAPCGTPAAPGAASAAHGAASPVAQPRGGNTTAVLAGVGVLLLSMGVGVLIGRTSAPGARGSTGPAQVVLAPGAASGAGPATTQAPAATTTAPPASKPAAGHGAKPSSPTGSGSSSGAHSSGGVGQTPGNPAPPSVAEHKHGESGQSYEQKSKNLPNVVSTG